MGVLVAAQADCFQKHTVADRERDGGVSVDVIHTANCSEEEFDVVRVGQELNRERSGEGRGVHGTRSVALENELEWGCGRDGDERPGEDDDHRDKRRSMLREAFLLFEVMVRLGQETSSVNAGGEEKVHC